MSVSGESAARKASGYSERHDVVIVGGGAGGLVTAAGLLRRYSNLDFLVLECRNEHYYQPDGRLSLRAFSPASKPCGQGREWLVSSPL